MEDSAVFYKESVVTRLEDFDRKGNMTPCAILKIFDNISGRHSAYVKDSVIDGSLKGIAWILTEWQIELNRLPNYQDQLQVETWVTGKLPGISVHRGFLLTDGNGEVLVKGWSTFVLYSMQEQQIIRIGEQFVEQYQPENKTVFESRTRRLNPPAVWEREKAIGLRKTDIDYNGHLHNTAYLDLALEILPGDPGEYENIHSFRILYKASVKYEDHPVLKAVKEEDGWKIGIYCEDQLYTMVQIS